MGRSSPDGSGAGSRGGVSLAVFAAVDGATGVARYGGAGVGFAAGGAERAGRRNASNARRMRPRGAGASAAVGRAGGGDGASRRRRGRATAGAADSSLRRSATGERPGARSGRGSSTSEGGETTTPGSGERAAAAA